MKSNNLQTYKGNEKNPKRTEQKNNAEKHEYNTAVHIRRYVNLTVRPLIENFTETKEKYSIKEIDIY